MKTVENLHLLFSLLTIAPIQILLIFIKNLLALEAKHMKTGLVNFRSRRLRKTSRKPCSHITIDRHTAQTFPVGFNSFRVSDAENKLQ
jgi:hypothetical protein